MDHAAPEPTVDWDHIEVLATLARSTGMSDTAERLGVSAGTLRQRLKVLNSLGAGPLVVRNAYGLRLTSVGRRLTRVALQMQNEVTDLFGKAGERRPLEGRVRVTAPEMVALDLLPPLFSTLLQRHRGLEICVGVTPRLEDLMRGEADIGLRFARPPQRAIISRAVDLGAIGFFAHRDYLALRGAPERVADLAAFDLLGAEDAAAENLLASMAVNGQGEDLLALQSVQLGQAEAIRQALGIGAYLIGKAQRHAGLVRVLPSVSARRDLWVCAHADLIESPRVRMVMSAITDFLRADSQSAPALA